MGKKAVNKKKILEHIFDRVAPGTALREAIDKIQEAKLGALIVLGNPNDLKDVMGGGFMSYLKWMAELFCRRI